MHPLICNLGQRSTAGLSTCSPVPSEQGKYQLILQAFPDCCGCQTGARAAVLQHSQRWTSNTANTKNWWASEIITWATDFPSLCTDEPYSLLLNRSACSKSRKYWESCYAENGCTHFLLNKTCGPQPNGQTLNPLVNAGTAPSPASQKSSSGSPILPLLSTPPGRTTVL